MDAPGKTTAVPGAAPRRAQSADRVKTGAAQRAYARRRNRIGGGELRLPGGTSIMGGRIPFVTAILVLLGCGLALTLVLTTRSAEDSYQLGDARRLNRQLTDERAELQREVAAADSAPELANRARELGMIPAKDPARLLVAPDGTVTVVGKEVPADGTPVPPLNGAPSTLPPNNLPAKGERLVPVNPPPPNPSVPPAGPQNLPAAPQVTLTMPQQVAGPATAPQPAPAGQSANPVGANPVVPTANPTAPAAPAPAATMVPAPAPVVPVPVAPIAVPQDVPAPAADVPAAQQSPLGADDPAADPAPGADPGPGSALPTRPAARPMDQLVPESLPVVPAGTR
ncbi:hypothetical protein EBN03_27225 [Nocardia stercoris]|uniref:Cell division protein FtsL n=1 Tax=Nocardia stercoris TaxID=2483361 RepID=A0A3M2KU01_9NOCA|nr:hypothetical protein EBN03_27225 [Nocardia stercoris]